MEPSIVVVSKLPKLVAPDKVIPMDLPPIDSLASLDLDPEVAEYRLAYVDQIRKFYPAINEDTALVLGQMAANRARYGVTYPQVYQSFLDNLDRQILASV